MWVYYSRTHRGTSQRRLENGARPWIFVVIIFRAFFFAVSNHNFRNVVDKSTLINSSESFIFIHCFANLFYEINLHKSFFAQEARIIGEFSVIISVGFCFSFFFAIPPQQPSGMICATPLLAQNQHRFWPPAFGSSAPMPPHAIRPKLGSGREKSKRPKGPFHVGHR